MSDLIKREDAIKALCDAVDNKGDYEGEWLYTDEFCKAIDSVPSADNEVIGKLKTAIENEEICKNCPTAERISGENLLGAMALGFSYGMEADRPQGEWIYGEHNVAMCDGYRCNRCDFFVPWDYEHKFIDFINDYHFCPNCGCRMKGADDEDNH